MTKASVLICIVDDDDAFCDSLSVLLGLHGFDVQIACDAESFLSSLPVTSSGCVLIDVNMPRVSGVELLELLRKRHFALPCIMMTGQGQVATAVRAMKAGAIDFIEKPFESQLLLDCIERALKSQQQTNKPDGEAAVAKLAKLTPREREVLIEIAKGHPNKFIARELGISPRTVEIHRAHLMEKLSASSIAEVVLIAVDARLLETEQD
jgi:two-component system, LuxR family, response regulator FixJ